MNSKTRNTGFTLLEILVAMAIIVSIVSMVYAGFSAAAGSAKTYNSKIDISEQAQKTIGEMARQIRCAFAPQPKYSSNNKPDSSETNTAAKIGIDYFSATDGRTGGDFLHLITADTFFDGCRDIDGLFDITYSFSKNSGEILIARQPFLFTSGSDHNSKSRQTVMKNVRSVELAFFDGRQWINDWNFKETNKLPQAVKINILCQDNNSRLYQFGTAANLSCSDPRKKYKNEIETKK